MTVERITGNNFLLAGWLIYFFGGLLKSEEIVMLSMATIFTGAVLGLGWDYYNNPDKREKAVENDQAGQE